jgi:hypothetical protein
LKFIKVSVEGIPAKTYYEINWQKYESELSLQVIDNFSLAKKTKLAGTFGGPSITETTP